MIYKKYVFFLLFKYVVYEKKILEQTVIVT